jgi:pentatricopeptide repeat protein
MQEYRTVLTEWFRMTITPESLPIERIISNFMLEVPLPPKGRLKVHYRITNKHVEFARSPANNPLLLSHFSYGLLFQCLDVKNVEIVIEALMLEQRTLILSSQMSALCIVTECITKLMYPFEWHHVYIPLLPRSLTDFLYAPYPFLIGTDPAFVHGFVDEMALSELCVVDLDNNTVTCPRQEAKFPPKERAKLLKALNPLQAIYRRAGQHKQLEALDEAFYSAPPPEEFDAAEPIPTQEEIQALEITLRQAFFRMFVSLFKDYKSFLVTPTEENPYPESSFNTTAFLKKVPSSSHAFIRAFTNTQAFAHFAEARVFNDESKQLDIVFFDQSIVAKRNRNTFSRRQPTPFLDSKEYAFSDTKYDAPVPDVSGLNLDNTYVYETWPKFQNDLFITETRFPSPLGDLTGEGCTAVSFDPSPPVKLIYDVWFYVFSALMEECGSRDHLFLGFDILGYMTASNVEPGNCVFSALMRACEAKGDTEACARLVDEMSNFGFQPDSKMQNSILSVFTKYGSRAVGYQLLEKLSRKVVRAASETAHSRHRRTPSIVDFNHSTGRARGSVSSPAQIDREHQKHILMFEIVFSGLHFALDPCEECGGAFNDSALRAQWTNDPNLYTIICPRVECKQQITPRFQILPTGEAPNPANSIIYQSPAVLQKNITKILQDKKAPYLSSPQFVEAHRDTYWNLAWHLTNYNLPVDFCILRVDNTVVQENKQVIFAPGYGVPSALSPRSEKGKDTKGGFASRFRMGKRN